MAHAHYATGECTKLGARPASSRLQTEKSASEESEAPLSRHDRIPERRREVSNVMCAPSTWVGCPV